MFMCSDRDDVLDLLVVCDGSRFSGASLDAAAAAPAAADAASHVAAAAAAEKCGTCYGT